MCRGSGSGSKVLGSGGVGVRSTAQPAVDPPRGEDARRIGGEVAGVEVGAQREQPALGVSDNLRDGGR